MFEASVAAHLRRKLLHVERISLGTTYHLQAHSHRSRILRGRWRNTTLSLASKNEMSDSVCYWSMPPRQTFTGKILMTFFTLKKII